MLRDPSSVVQFWRDAGPKMWFAKDADFDSHFRERFLAHHEAAARRQLMEWLATAEGALALVLLLDQFPRNAFRDTPRMYATDALACDVADQAITASHDRAVPEDLALFFYLPLAQPRPGAASLRYRAALRPLSPSQRHPRPRDDRRRATLPR